MIGLGLGPARPWFSNSLFDGRKCTALTSTGWKSRGRGLGRAEASKTQKGRSSLVCFIWGTAQAWEQPWSWIAEEEWQPGANLNPPQYTDTGLLLLRLLTLSLPRGTIRVGGHSFPFLPLEENQRPHLYIKTFTNWQMYVSRQPLHTQGTETKDPDITGHAASPLPPTNH